MARTLTPMENELALPSSSAKGWCLDGVIECQVSSHGFEPSFRLSQSNVKAMLQSDPPHIHSSYSRAALDEMPESYYAKHDVYVEVPV